MPASPPSASPPSAAAPRHGARRTGTARLGLAGLLAAVTLVAGACASSGSDGSARAAGDTTTSTTAPPVTAAPAGEVADAPPVPSKGCGRSTVRRLDADKQYLDDSDRWFLLTTPAAHDGTTPVPLVVDFHGLMEGADVHAQMSGLGPFGATHGFAVVTPNGTGNPLHWDVGVDVDANADLAFVHDLLGQLEAELCVDTSRVYATGLSNGAMMTSTVACTMADRFAAVAPVSGLLHPEPCPAARPVPLLAFHGTDDPILLFNGGGGNVLGRLVSEGMDRIDVRDETLPPADLHGPGYPANAQAWATANGCTGDPVDAQLTPTVIQRTWDCPADAPVVFDIIEGGGHTWPGSSFSANLARVMGATDLSIDANEQMWAFFQRFALPA